MPSSLSKQSFPKHVWECDQTMEQIWICSLHLLNANVRQATFEHSVQTVPGVKGCQVSF